jgi:nicotinamidase-related amidase
MEAPMTTALLMIDIQQGMWMEPKPPHNDKAFLKNAAALLEKARAKGVPVIHIQHDGGPEDVLHEGHEGFAIRPEVAPKAGEKKIVKYHCSSFRDTELDRELKMLGVDNLVVAGMQTDFCIDTACRIAHGLGYNVTLAEDAHTTLDNQAMTAEQLIAYHGGLLKDRFATFKPVAQIDFAD